MLSPREDSPYLLLAPFLGCGIVLLFLDLRLCAFIVLGLLAGLGNSLSKSSFRSFRALQRSTILTVVAALVLFTPAAVIHRISEYKSGMLEPSAGEMTLTLVGLLVVLAAYPMLRWFRREFPNAPRTTSRLVGLLFVTSGLLLIWFFSPVALLPREISCDYFGSVRFDGKNRMWLRRGQLVPQLQADEKILRPANGWEAGEGLDRSPSFENERLISALTVWYQAKTINRITFPELFTRFQTSQGYFFPRLTDKSKVEMIVPRYSIGRTYPAFEQRADMLDGNEALRIPVQFTFDTVPELRIELVNPVLRNFVGAAVLTGAAWSPFKWLVLAFFGVIGDQIKKRYLTRAVRKLFRRLRVIYGHRKTRVRTRKRPAVA